MSVPVTLFSTLEATLPTSLWEQKHQYLLIAYKHCVFNTSLSLASPQPPASMNYPKYTGCIEFVSFNDKALSLYNFQSVENVNLETPCKRYSLLLKHPVGIFFSCCSHIKETVCNIQQHLVVEVPYCNQLKNHPTPSPQKTKSKTKEIITIQTQPIQHQHFKKNC